MSSWSLYVVRTKFGELYTGIATDVDRRLEEHRSPAGKGAKFLRGRGPLRLELRCALGSRGLALRAEHAFKRLSKPEKERVLRRAPGARLLLEELDLEGAGDPPDS